MTRIRSASLEILQRTYATTLLLETVSEELESRTYNLAEEILWRRILVADEIVVISPSEKKHNFWKRIVPECFIYEQDDTDTLQAIERFTKLHQLEETTLGKRKRRLLVWDHLPIDRTKHASLLSMLNNGRCVGMSLLLLLRSRWVLPPELIVNVDFKIRAFPGREFSFLIEMPEERRMTYTPPDLQSTLDYRPFWRHREHQHMWDVYQQDFLLPLLQSVLQSCLPPPLVRMVASY